MPDVLAVHRWQGELRHDAEILLVMKTTTDAVEDGHAPYLAWVREEVGGPA
mgnify:CR=1 FL=1